jgi:hypothetical protein
VSVPTIEGGSIVLLLATQVVMRIFERRKDNNGGNPVVKAVNRMEETMKAVLAAYEKRMGEHEQREESQWRDVGVQLGNVPKRGEK